MTANEWVDLNALRPLPTRALSAGGQSESLTFQFLGSSNEVFIFKRYKLKIRESNPEARLLELVRWRRSLNADNRAELDSKAAWVRHLVKEGGELVGVLVPPAPDKFWVPDSEGRAVPRSLEALVADEDAARSKEKDGTLEFFSIPHSVARLGHLLETINFLHRQKNQVVIGDVQMGNVLVSGLSAAPSTYLVDCDSVLLSGRWTLPASEVPLMRHDPLGADSLLNRRTDLEKFALLVVWAIEKEVGLLELDESSINVLTSEHGRLINDLLAGRFSQVPPPEDFATIATVWQRYVHADRSEYYHTPGQIVFIPWDGPPSIQSPLPDVTSPAASHAMAARVRRVPDRPRQPDIPVRPPLRPHVARRRRRARIILAGSVVVVLGLVILGYLRFVGTVDFPLPWDPQPISPLIDPATRSMPGESTVAQEMERFANIGSWGGNIEISRVPSAERSDVILVALSPTRITSIVATEIAVTYDCSRRGEVRDEGLPTENYIIAPGPYLAVSGDLDEAANAGQSPSHWRIDVGTAAGYVLYAPSCTFPDSTATGTSFRSTEVSAHDTVAIANTESNQLVFVLPAGAGTAGNPRVVLSFVWVCDDGTYLLGDIPRME